MAWVIGAIVIAGILGGFYVLVARAPTCVCNRPDCGGGCWPKEPK